MNIRIGDEEGPSVSLFAGVMLTCCVIVLGGLYLLNSGLTASAEALTADWLENNVSARDANALTVSVTCVDYPLREGARPVVCHTEDQVLLHVAIPTDVQFSDSARVRYHVSAEDGTTLANDEYGIVTDMSPNLFLLILPTPLSQYDLASRSYTVSVALNTGSYTIGGKFSSSPCKAR